MTVLRWFALLFVLLFVLMIPLSTVLDVAAQDTESESSSSPLKSAAVRQFKNEGLAILEPSFIAAFVYVLDSTEAATLAFPEVARTLVDEAGDSESGGLRPASAPMIGDERKAYAGQGEIDGEKVQVGLVIWREGERIYALWDGGHSGEMLDPLFDLAPSLTGRELPTDQGVLATSPGELSSGGVYELLPSLDDMPPGWVFVEDVDIVALSAARATPTP